MTKVQVTQQWRICLKSIWHKTKQEVYIGILAVIIWVGILLGSNMVSMHKNLLSNLENTSVTLQQDITSFVINEAKLNAEQTKISFSVYEEQHPDVKWLARDDKNRYIVSDRYKYFHFVFDPELMWVDRSTVDNSWTAYWKNGVRARDHPDVHVMPDTDNDQIVFTNCYFEYSSELYKFLRLIVLGSRIGGSDGDPIVTNGDTGEILQDTSNNCKADPSTVINGSTYMGLIPNHPSNMNPTATLWVYEHMVYNSTYEGPWYYFFTDPRVKKKDLDTDTVFSKSWFKKYPLLDDNNIGVEAGWVFELKNPYTGLEQYASPVRISYAGQSYECYTHFDQSIVAYELVVAGIEEFGDYILILILITTIVILFVLFPFVMRILLLNHISHHHEIKKRGGVPNDNKNGNHKHTS